MKRMSLLVVLAVLITAIEAKEKKEPIVMTVVGKDVLLSEFLFMAKKDNSVDFKNKESVKNYVELFKNYKLKVADAEALGIHTAPKFEAELEKYKQQLQQSYLSDKPSQDSAMRLIYERSKTIPGIKQIMFSYPEELILDRRVLTKDTVAIYAKAAEAYERIRNGESFEEVGQALMNGADIIYMVMDYVFPFQFPKVMEDYIFSMAPGSISQPLRSMYGFHLIKSDRIIPNPGKIKVEHIVSLFPSGNPTDDEIEATRQRSEEIYQKALSNEDFKALITAFSDDTVNAKRGGFLEFGLGEVLEPIEKAGFALENIGDISKPFQSRRGFHILKLVDRKEEKFEDIENIIFEAMKSSERFLDLNRGFDERMKGRHQFVFYPEAFEELKNLADDYHPMDSIFIDRGIEMDKMLVQAANENYTQADFVKYIYYKNKTPYAYSIDFLIDVFNHFVRDILTGSETRSLEKDYPDYKLQLKEYYDGILLFELSNKRIWMRPVEEQEQLEAEWIKELNEKYPVTIHWKVINKIR